MGSKQIQAKYDRLNKKYSQKYEIDAPHIAKVRSAVITNKNSREEVVDKFKQRLANLIEEKKKIESKIPMYEKSIQFLTTCSKDDFEDLTRI